MPIFSGVKPNASVKNEYYFGWKLVFFINSIIRFGVISLVNNTL
jgi:hypothetical protein